MGRKRKRGRQRGGAGSSGNLSSASPDRGEDEEDLPSAANTASSMTELAATGGVPAEDAAESSKTTNLDAPPATHVDVSEAPPPRGEAVQEERRVSEGESGATAIPEQDDRAGLADDSPRPGSEENQSTFSSALESGTARNPEEPHAARADSPVGESSAQKPEAGASNAADAAGDGDEPHPVPEAADVVEQEADDEEPNTVESLLADMHRERRDLDDRITELDAEVDQFVGELTQQRVNAEERAGVAREHERLLLEEVEELSAEVAAFPSDSLLAALQRTYVQKLEAKAQRHITALRLMLETNVATTGSVVEGEFAQNALDMSALSLSGVYALSRKQKYTYGSMDEKYLPAAALDTVAAVTDNREMLARVAHSDLAELLETEMMLDGDCLDVRQRDAAMLHDIHEHRSALEKAIQDSWETEKTALQKALKKHTDISKEQQFHLRRGSSQARPTARTEDDKRVQEKCTALQTELKKHIREFEGVRKEIMELEGVGEKLLKELEDQRAQHQRELELRQNALARHRELKTELTTERSHWVTLKSDLETLMKRHRTKITDAARAEQEAMLRHKSWVKDPHHQHAAQGSNGSAAR